MQKIVTFTMSAQKDEKQSDAALELLKLSKGATDLRQEFKDAAEPGTLLELDDEDVKETTPVFYHLF